MNFLKKNWYFIMVLLVTVGLGVMTFLTTQKVSQPLPISPNVPQAKPAAAEPACTLQFSLNPPAKCGDTCGTNTDCPSDNTCSGSKCVLSTCLSSGVNCAEDKCSVVGNTPTPTMTPTGTPSPTPTPPPAACNTACSVNADCASGLSCLEGACRNPSCSDQTNCTCPVVVLASCNSACSVNTDCKNGLVCLDGSCRNADCSEKTNCSCAVAQATPTPKIPVSGTGPGVLGATAVAGGALLLLLGLAL